MSNVGNGRSKSHQLLTDLFSASFISVIARALRFVLCAVDSMRVRDKGDGAIGAAMEIKISQSCVSDVIYHLG